MVSAIVTTYNRAKLLEKCLRSIIAQTYHDIEIIVLDDGSTDNTYDVVKSFQDERISYYNFGRTGNVSYLRNKGIKISKMKYVAFCDDDDVWMSNKLEVQLKCLEKEKAVSSNGNVIDENDLIITENNNSYEDTYFDLPFILKDNRVLTSSVIVLKDIFNEIGLYDESHKSRCEDYEMWIRIASKYKFRYIGQVLISYRLHPQNLSRKSYFDAQEVYETNINLLSPYSRNSDYEVAKSAKIGITFLYKRLIRVSFVKGHFFDSLFYIKGYFITKLSSKPKAKLKLFLNEN